MKYVEASKFGGPEVLAIIEKETPKPGEGILLVINYADVLARSGRRDRGFNMEIVGSGIVDQRNRRIVDDRAPIGRIKLAGPRRQTGDANCPSALRRSGQWRHGLALRADRKGGHADLRPAGPA